MRSHLGSRDAKRLTVVWALSPETGLLRSPAGSTRWPEPRAGSSRGWAGCPLSSCLRQVSVWGKEGRSRHVSLARMTATRARPKPALGSCGA